MVVEEGEELVVAYEKCDVTVTVMSGAVRAVELRFTNYW